MPKFVGNDALAKIRDWARSVFYSKPSTGIPENDLSSAVQTKLNAGSVPDDIVRYDDSEVGSVVLTNADRLNGYASSDFQMALTFDSTPTANSNNPVTSGGVASTINGINSSITTINTTLAGKQNTLTFDNTPTANSNNPVKSGGIKSAIDSAVDPLKVAYIVETYHNGTSWYRVWSDGWCEQGGRKTVSGDGDYSVTFLKAFVDTNYTITQWAGLSSKNSTQYNNGLNIISLSTTGFSYNSWAYDNTLFWRAEGYIN